MGNATVKFAGPVKFDSGLWVGLQLDKGVSDQADLPAVSGMSGRLIIREAAKNNGTVKGVTYFECPDGCGIFVKPESLEMVFTKEHPSSYSGGAIKSNSGEEWSYNPSGLVSSKVPPVPPSFSDLRKSSTGSKSSTSGTATSSRFLPALC